MHEAARTPQSTPATGTAAAMGPTRAGVGAELPAHATGRPPAPFGIAAGVSLLAGVVACLLLPALPPAPVFVAALAGGAVLWWLGAARRRLGRGPGWRSVGPFLLGMALAGLHAAHALSVQLPADGPRRDVVVRGRVVELPDHRPRRTTFLLRIDRDADQPEALRGRLLRASWFDDFDGGSTGRERVRAGQRWELPLRVRAPRGLRNPGGQDSEKHALARRLAGAGYVHMPASARLLGPARGIDAWRETVSARIAAVIPDGSARYVQALALGDTRGLGDGDWLALRATGLTHLIAISGFHVGLVAGFFALVAGGLWRLWPGLGRALPRPVAAALAGLAGAAVYAAVAGFALPTVRTVLMIAVVAAVRLLRRHTGMFDALALAGIAVLLVDPLAVLGAGFWLSFLGVAWLVWCLPEAGRRPLHDLLGAQGVATVGLLPLTVVLFNQASLAGPVANLVAVPWWSLVVVPLALLGTALEAVAAGAGDWPWRAAAWCFDLSWPLFEAMAGSELALWWVPESRWYALPLALLGAFWLLLPRGLPGRPLALLLWLPLLYPDREVPAPGEAELRVLDVGQGLAVVVRTANHVLLYDMGPAVPEGFDAGERVVVPTLRALGVRRIDRAVVSHADNDHAGGLAAVRATFPLPALDAPEGSGVDGAGPCEAGRTWQWDGVAFRYLHPPRYFPYLRNEASCVLRIDGAHGSMLLTGDIGAVVERELVRRAGLDPADALRVDVVLVAHHGSGGSSDPAFVAATGAQVALVASGHGNRFGHPRREVVERWRSGGARTLDTARAGALAVRLAADGLRVESRRRTRPRLWDAARRADGASAEPAEAVSYRPD